MTELGGLGRPLAGEVAIVTGGGRGIGRAAAQALAQAGARIALAARSSDQLEETARLIREQGGEALTFPLDVTDQAAVEAMVRDTEARLGPVDLLVNNAGASGHENMLWEEDASDWWRVVEVNLRGSFLCARAVLPGMIARKRGRIINVVSGAGTAPFAVNSSYPVSKAALFRLTDCMAAMTDPHGVSVFAVSPGLVHTVMADGMQMFKELPEEAWLPIERSAELCVALATGIADRLSGRYIHAEDNLTELIGRADEIVQDDLYVLRLRK